MGRKKQLAETSQADAKKNDVVNQIDFSNLIRENKSKQNILKIGLQPAQANSIETKKKHFKQVVAAKYAT